MPDLIKSFSLHKLIKGFRKYFDEGKDYLFSSFVSLRWKIASRPLLWLHIYRLKEMNDNRMVYMVTQERRSFPEAVVICFASITYHLQKALPINRFFVLTLNEKEWCVTRQNVCIGVQFPTRSAKCSAINVSSRKVPPHKEAKTSLRDKTNNCCKKVNEEG